MGKCWTPGRCPWEVTEAEEMPNCWQFVSWFLEQSKTLNPSKVRLANLIKIPGKFLSIRIYRRGSNSPQEPAWVHQDEPRLTEFLSFKDTQDRSDWAAFDKRHGVAIWGKPSAKPLRPRTGRWRWPAWWHQHHGSSDGVSLSAWQTSPTIPKAQPLTLSASTLFLAAWMKQNRRRTYQICSWHKARGIVNRKDGRIEFQKYLDRLK